MGSSRALQGLDPQALQQALAQQGHPGLEIYNFSVNGATAQVVSFLTRQLFAPDLYPQMVVWAVGSRSFQRRTVLIAPLLRFWLLRAMLP